MPQTVTLAPDQTSEAARLLAGGALVAIPTETVYGLAADALNDRAVAEIFAAKDRPSFNPLILHVPDLDSAERLAVFDDTARSLAEAFWPGPLTLVLPLRPEAGIAPLVTAGLDSVALRVPAHPLAQEVLHALGRPVAAPSANPSGRISPTTVAHVQAGLGGRVAAILDGGPCGVGLESTIVGCVEAPTLLRPGGIAAEQIEAVLDAPLASHSGEISAPGQMISHYAPRRAVRLGVTKAAPGEAHLGFGAVPGDLSLSASGDLTEAAATLFQRLHQLDALDQPIAVAPVPEQGLGRAINDRLRRAAAPRGR